MWERVDSRTPYTRGFPSAKRKEGGRRRSLWPMGVPEDHVGAAVFLASPYSDYVVAQTLMEMEVIGWRSS